MSQVSLSSPTLITEAILSWAVATAAVLLHAVIDGKEANLCAAVLRDQKRVTAFINIGLLNTYVPPSTSDQLKPGLGLGVQYRIL